MTTKKDKLQRLQIASPCSSSWEAMQGDGRRRRCLECDKPVYDFAQLTPREIAGVIEASQGELCARLTRDDWGRLVTLQPPVTADPLAARRASPLVTAVVTAALGLSGTAWTAQTATVSYAQDLQDVFADFLSAGEAPGREVNPVILAAFLTDAHRERLTAALLSTPKVTEADLGLYRLVGPWHDDRLLPWVIDQLKTADLADGAGRYPMTSFAVVLDDADLPGLRATDEAQIMDLEQQLDNASEDAERQRLGRQLEAAQEELRRQLIEALEKRR